MEPEKLKSLLSKGAVLPVLLTPFKENGELDEEGLRENVRFLLETSRDKLDQLVLIPAGSTGEFYALSADEHKKVIRTVVDEANGKVIVIAGVAHAGTKETISMAKYAKDVGADGVMVVLPYYHVPSNEGIYLHYKRLSEEVDIGIMVYNNPSASKCYIFPPLMARLVSDIPNIVAIKENTTHMATYYWMKKTVGDKVPIFCGLGEFWYAIEVIFGCPGFVSGFANFVPNLSLELLDAGLKQDFKRIQEVMSKFDPLYDFIREVADAHAPHPTILPFGFESHTMWLSVMKAAMDLLGLHGGPPRLPIEPLTDKEKDRLANVLEGMGLSIVRR